MKRNQPECNRRICVGELIKDYSMSMDHSSSLQFREFNSVALEELITSSQITTREIKTIKW